MKPRQKTLNKIIIACRHYGIFNIKDIYHYLEEQISISTIYNYFRYMLSFNLIDYHSPNGLCGDYDFIEERIKLTCKLKRIKNG